MQLQLNSGLGAAAFFMVQAAAESGSGRLGIGPVPGHIQPMTHMFFLTLVSALILVGCVLAAYWLDGWTIRLKGRR